MACVGNYASYEIPFTQPPGGGSSVVWAEIPDGKVFIARSNVSDGDYPPHFGEITVSRDGREVGLTMQGYGLGTPTTYSILVFAAHLG